MADVFISGSSAGQSGASGTLTKHNTRLIGSSAGQSGVSGTLTKHNTRLRGTVYALSSAKGIVSNIDGALTPSWVITDPFLSKTLKDFVWPGFAKKIAATSIGLGATTYNSQFPISLEENNYDGNMARTYRDDFYYRIHIYDKPIDLGLIFQNIETDFYVWNSYFISKTLDEIIIVDPEGTLILEGQTAPFTFQPQQLKTYTAKIPKEGMPIYETTIGFDFGAEGIIDVVITGMRVAILFWRPESKIRETLEWKTDILRAHKGVEQRIKLRQTPRQFFRLQFVLETNKMNSWFDSTLHTWQKRIWGIPVWTEYTTHTEDINIDDTIINVDTKYADYLAMDNRDRSYAIIWKSALEYEVVAIDSVEDDKLNLRYPIQNSFIGIKFIMPFRIAYMTSKNTKQKYNSLVSITEALFAIYDNIDITGYTPLMTYDNLEVLTIPSYMAETHQEESDGQIEINDFQTGIFKVRSDKEYNLLSQNHIFYNDTKEVCWKYRQFLHWLSGRQKAVLIPTFRNDLNLTDPVGSADEYFFVENIKLTINMGFNALRTYIGFYFPTDKILIVRKIINIEEIDSTKEKISIRESLGKAATAENCKVCFVDKCRLTSDRVEMNWPFAHRNESQPNLTRVP